MRIVVDTLVLPFPRDALAILTDRLFTGYLRILFRLKESQTSIHSETWQGCRFSLVVSTDIFAGQGGKTFWNRCPHQQSPTRVGPQTIIQRIWLPTGTFNVGRDRTCLVVFGRGCLSGGGGMIREALVYHQLPLYLCEIIGAYLRDRFVSYIGRDYEDYWREVTCGLPRDRSWDPFCGTSRVMRSWGPVCRLEWVSL